MVASFEEQKRDRILESSLSLAVLPMTVSAQGVIMETQGPLLVSLCYSDQDKNKGVTLIDGNYGFPF